MTARSLPHIDPRFATPVWRLGPLDRPAISTLCAEIALRVPAVGLRPQALVVLPHLAAQTAVLYLSDVAANARLIPYLLGLGATICAEVDVGGPAWIAGLAFVQRWAAAPPPAARLALPPRVLATPPVPPPCRDCGLPNTDPAPRSTTLCRSCWRARIAAGHARRRELDAAFLASRGAAA